MSADRSKTILKRQMHGESILAFIVIVVVGVLVLFLRNPDPIFNPVLYTEDAAWASNLVSGERFAAYFYSRPDYLVVGQIFMLDLAVQISLLTTGSLSIFPQTVAGISYVFWSFLAALTFIALRAWLSLRWRLLSAAFILLLPLGAHANEIIGRISNLGYLFLPLSFLFVLLRDKPRSRLVSAVLVAGLVVCIFTNPICVAMAGAHLGLRLLRRFFRKERIRWLGDIMLGLATATFVALFIARLGQGIPYSEDPLIQARLIELIGARSFLYPIVFPIYDKLDDLTTVLTAAALCALVTVAIYRSPTRQRLFGALLAATTVASIGIVIATRPGLTHHLTGYGSTFPDRYYTAQNIFVGLLLIWSISRLPKPAQFVGLSAFVLVFALGSTRLFEFDAPSLRLAAEGNFADYVAAAVTRHPNAEDQTSIQVDGYPHNFPIHMPASLARATAEDTAEWRSPTPPVARVDLGALPRQPLARQATADAATLTEIQLRSIALNDLTSDGSILRSSGGDPFVLFQASEPASTTALLSFDLTCEGGAPLVEMQAFWSTAAQPTMAEARSLLFTAGPGRNVVPLDAHPSWSASGMIDKVRLDFARPHACDGYRLDDLHLERRP